MRADWHEQRPQPIGGRRRLLLISPAVSLPVATKFKTPSDGHVYCQQGKAGDVHRDRRALNTFNFSLRLPDKVTPLGGHKLYSSILSYSTYTSMSAAIVHYTRPVVPCLCIVSIPHVTKSGIYVRSPFICMPTVTHFTTNQARCISTSLTQTNGLPLCQVVTIAQCT